MTDLIDMAEKETPVGAQQSVALQDERTVVVNADATSLMAVISRAASDPNTDVDKLERLMAMYERITDRSAKAEYSAALAEMQPELPVITERGAISTDKGKTVQSTYAKWEDINEAIRPVLAKHGFALSFRVGTGADGKITVTGILSHRGGHQEDTTMTLPHDSSGSKNAVQAVGSSTSYGKRYTAQALLNLTSRGEDDDGQAGGDSARTYSEAAKRAIEAINGHETEAALMEWKTKHSAGVQKIVTAGEWDEIVALWRRRAKALKAAASEPADDFPGDRR